MLGTPRHKPETPRKPRPTRRPQTPSRVIHAYDEHPSRAKLLSDATRSKTKICPGEESGFGPHGRRCRWRYGNRRATQERSPRLRKAFRSRGESDSPRERTSLLTRAGSRTPRGPDRRAPCAGCPSASRAGRHCPWMPATPETKHAAAASSRRACSVLMRFLDRGVASRKTPPRSPGVLNRKLSISDAVYSR